MAKADDNKDQDQPAKPAAKKRSKALISHGRVYIKTSFNNTLVSVTDSKGNLLVAASAGSCGFKGTKKGTAYAASVAVDRALSQAKSQHGLRAVRVYVRGISQPTREAALRGLMTAGVVVESLADRTPVAHGGVRPRGLRRV